MIFTKINCPNFSRLVWRRHTCHTASGATARLKWAHDCNCSDGKSISAIEAACLQVRQYTNVKHANTWYCCSTAGQAGAWTLHLLIHIQTV